MTETEYSWNVFFLVCIFAQGIAILPISLSQFVPSDNNGDAEEKKTFFVFVI